MTFPGTRWNMSVEEFINALDLEEDSYTINQTEDSYSIIVPQVNVFDASADAAFQFTLRENGEIGGLYHIQINFTEDTDMSAVLSEMMSAYGTPEPADEERTDAYNQHVKCWNSELRQIEALPQEERNEFERAFQEGIGREIHEDDPLYTAPMAYIIWSDDASQRYTVFEVWPYMVEFHNSSALMWDVYEEVCG